jgi:pimeloyl-ACP methyl ester carboxylesterase
VTDGTRQKVRGPTPDGRGRLVDWKLLFNQLFALEIIKERVLPLKGPEALEAIDRLLRAFTSYTPISFNDALEEILEVESSEAAYRARGEIYQDPANRGVISTLDFARSVGAELREYQRIGAYLDAIWSHHDRQITAEESFFESPEGLNVLDAFKVDGASDEQEVALIMVPGFAGHTIKYYIFEEMMWDVNTSHGRPAERPLLKEDGIELEFEDHVTFYERSQGGSSTLDILQPGGSELGNTTGRNVETVDRLYQWITSLPERYAAKKLIFLGYSRGGPVILDLVNRHPDLAPRILGYVTFGGVVQGTHSARLSLNMADTILKDVTVREFVEQLRHEDPTHLGRILSPLVSDLDLSWLSLPRIREVFEIFGHDLAPIERQIDKVLGSRELHEILEGARDLTPFERSRWCLENLDDETFDRETFIFNISALTDTRDFVSPPSSGTDGSGTRSLLTPALTPEGKLDWTQLSLDALFLYLTSLEGFKTAPGGLFDAQVELAGTKMPMLDRRPLSDSLTPEELEALWEDGRFRTVLRRNGIRSLDDLSNRPRRDLIPAARRTHIDAIDLGELRGHHWLPFIQALRPPPELSTTHAVWDFPRKALMRALLQTLAFHNLVSHELRPAADDGRASGAGLAPPASDDDEHRDVVLAHMESDEQGRAPLLNLYNLGARAVTYGLVVNSARTGLGTAAPLGPVLAAESHYYQALRIYSYFDWEFRRGLLNDPSVWPLPESLALLIGRFPTSFAQSYPEEPISRMEEVRKALKALTPRLNPAEIRRLGSDELTTRPGSSEVSYPAAVRDALWEGSKAKLASIEHNAYNTDVTDLHVKLGAMLGAFTPLCTVFRASFDRASPLKSSTNLTLYLPAFHTLHMEDLDQPQGWYLEKGLPDLRLPHPVQLTTAEITHIRYLRDADLAKAQGVKIELRRDFSGRDNTTTVVSFGTMFEGAADDLFAFDSSDYRDALQVVFRPRFSLDEGENPADRAFRDAFNRLFGVFEIEARLHQLTLHNERRWQGVSHPTDDDAVLRPRFTLAESRISFRVHRYVDTAVERLPLQAAGFTCEVDEKTRRYHCWQDFWTWDHLLDEFFAGRSLGAGRLPLPTYFRERLVEQLVGSATRAVLDRSIVAIEDAIDKEIDRLTDDSFKRYSKARGVLIDRLHDWLF